MAREREHPSVLFCVPHRPEVVQLGRFVTDRHNPQDYFESPKSHEIPPQLKTEAVSIESPFFVRYLLSGNGLLPTSPLHLSPTGGKGITKVHLDGSQANRYVLKQPGKWFNYLIGRNEIAHRWLQKTAKDEGQEIWMIVGITTMTDTDVRLASAKKRLGMMGKVQGSFAARGERVFEVQYARVIVTTIQGENIDTSCYADEKGNDGPTEADLRHGICVAKLAKDDFEGEMQTRSSSNGSLVGRLCKHLF